MRDSDNSTGGEKPTVAGDTGLGLVRVAGDDATGFLNAQITGTLVENTDEVRLAAFADARGRVLAVFHAWHDSGGWLLALPADETEWLCAHLARFVFRSRVRIAPAPDNHLLGLVGAAARAALPVAGIPAPGEGRIAGAGAVTAVGLPRARWLLAGEAAALTEIERALAADGAPLNRDEWKRARLLANEAEIRAETRARFLPQMLGLVASGAVSFRKGCYPGQEVIARAEHRGRIKRALALFQSDAAPAAGERIELEGLRLDVLDSVAAPAGATWVQAVAPSPMPDGLARHLRSPA